MTDSLDKVLKALEAKGVAISDGVRLMKKRPR
jgi:hypothetical protein